MAKVFYKLNDLRLILSSCVEQYEAEFGKADNVIESFYYTEGLCRNINECRIYSQAKRLILTTGHKQYVIPFGKILGYDIVDLKQSSTPLISATTTITKTDTGNMIKRAIIGGVIAGGVGAIIGAATATKTTTTEETQVDEFSDLLRKKTKSTSKLDLIINVNDIVSPTITISFDSNKKNIEKVASILNVIIKNNAESSDEEDSEIIYNQPTMISSGRRLGIEPTDPYKQYEEEYQRRMQQEREEAAHEAKRKEIGGYAAMFVLAFCIIVFFVITCSR